MAISARSANRRTAGVFVLVFALMLALVVASPVSAGKGKPGPSPTPTTPVRSVCIDAGHGGSDPGAVYGGMQEKNLTKQIADILKGKLEASSFGVVMTRSGDESLGNTDRAVICNTRTDASGNLPTTVLSIHLNASSDPTANYFKAFYGKLNKDGDFTGVIDAKYDLGIPHSSTGQFASGLLLKTNVPACLAETVFLSNPQEQELLRAGTRQQQIADELYKGIVAWYAQQ